MSKGMQLRKLAFAILVLGAGALVSGCESLMFDAIPRATFKDQPTVIEASKKGDIIKVTDRIIVLYANDVQKFMRLRMSGKRALRKISASIQVMTAAIATALAGFGGSSAVIAGFAGVSAIIPEFQSIFQAAEGAEAFRRGAELIGDAETDYIIEISKKGGQVQDALTTDGAKLYKRVVASIVVVEKALQQQIPTLKQIEEAEGKVEAKFGEDENTTVLLEWLEFDPEAAVGKRYANSENHKKLKDWLKDPNKGNLKGVPITFFLKGAKYAEARRKAVSALIPTQ